MNLKYKGGQIDPLVVLELKQAPGVTYKLHLTFKAGGSLLGKAEKKNYILIIVHRSNPSTSFKPN